MKTKMSLSALLPMLNKILSESIVEKLDKTTIADSTVKRVQCEMKADDVDDDSRSITAYLSTRDMDRDNEILMPKGADLSDYKLAPVILQGHDYTKPQVGKATGLTKSDYGVKAKITFAEPAEGQTDFFLLSKFMPLTFSVGFIPTKTLSPQDAGWGDTISELSTKWPEFKKTSKSLTRIIKNWTVLEASVVPVPANIHALQQTVAKAVEAGSIKAAEATLVLKSAGSDKDLGDIEMDAPEPEPQADAFVDGKTYRADTVEGKRVWIEIEDNAPEPTPTPKPAAKKLAAAEKYTAPSATLVKSAAQAEADRDAAIPGEVEAITKNVLDRRSGKV